MSVLTATPEAAAIGHKLRRAWGRERLFVHLRGLGHFVPWLAGMFFFDLLLDWSLVLPGWARVLLLLANLGVVGWLTYHHWLRHLRHFDSTRVSLQVEKLHPGLNSLLVSYVQLRGSSDPAYGSRHLIAAMCGQAEKSVAQLDFRGVVNFKKLRLLLAMAGCVLAGFLVSTIFAHNLYAIFLGRMLDPFGNLDYPPRTRIVEVRDPGTIKQGETARLEAEVAGEIPERGTISIRFENGSWEEFPLPRDDASRESATGFFTYKIGNAAQSFSYKYRIGDARSVEKTVRVVAPPRLVESRVILQFPSYIQKKDELHTRIQLPRPLPDGTAITWKLTCDQPLASAKLVVDGNQPLEFALVPQDDPHLVQLDIKDVRSLVPSLDREPVTIHYHLEWTVSENEGKSSLVDLLSTLVGGGGGGEGEGEERTKDTDNGRKFTFVDPTRYTLKVIPDRPPQVIVTRPEPAGAENPHLAAPVINLKFIGVISDDYGVSKVDVLYWVNPAPDEEKPPLRWPVPRTDLTILGASTVGVMASPLADVPAHAACAFTAARAKKFGDDDRSLTLDSIWNVQASYPSLKEGDLLKIAIEATDNRAIRSGPNVLTTRPLYYRIVSLRDFELLAGKKVDANFETLKQAQTAEVLSADKVKALIGKQKKTP